MEEGRKRQGQRCQRRRKRRKGQAAKLQLAGALILAALSAGFSGCGKKEGKLKNDLTVYYNSAGYLEEGMVYQDYDAGVIRYLDYATGECYPLCARPNCFHDSDECTAHALCGEIQFIGRLGDKWYYYQEDETQAEFHSCDLDGGNDRVIGAYPFEAVEEGGYENWGRGTAWGNVVFRDGSCFAAMSTDNLEEDPNDPDVFGSVSVNSILYRYDLETGEREALCEEKTMRIPCYTLWGIYEDQLIYSELLKDGDGERWVSGLRKLDLASKEITDLGILAGETLYPGCLSGNLLLYNEADGEETRLMEYDLETGEKRMIYEGYGSNVVWEPEFKTFMGSDSPGEDFKCWIYQYMGEGECKVLYEDEAFIPSVSAGDLVVGYSMEPPDLRWRRSVMKKEDFLAGKTNWTVIEGE